MKTPMYYEANVLAFFSGKPLEMELYNTLFRRMEEIFSDASVKVQKSQISFYDRHLFSAVSLPLRRKKNWPEHCIVVTIGLSHPLEPPRTAVSMEPYPGRWTNHVLISEAAQIDEELLEWLKEAWVFAESKR